MSKQWKVHIREHSVLTVCMCICCIPCGEVGRKIKTNIFARLNSKSRCLIKAATPTCVCVCVCVCVCNHIHVRCICINANHGSVALFTNPLLCCNDRIHNYDHMCTSCIHIITPSVALGPMIRDGPRPFAQNWDSAIQDLCTSNSLSYSAEYVCCVYASGIPLLWGEVCLCFGYAVAQFVQSVHYKPDSRGVRFPMVPLEFFIDIILPAAQGP